MMLRIVSLIWLLLNLPPILLAQNISILNGTGSISGTVTVTEKPAKGLLVNIKRTDGDVFQNNPGTSVATDASGNFSFDKLPLGKYRITVSSDGFFNPKKLQEWDDGGASVNLGDGERVDNLKFALMPGAVITGRLSDERGRAVIEEKIILKKIGQDGKSQIVPCNDQSDDRGIYRCYGLEPGKYFVGAGVDPSESNANLVANNIYARMWFPSVNDIAQAKIVDVKATEESTVIDIKLVRRQKGYKVLGKVIDANTANPVVGIMVGVAQLSENGQIRGISFGQNSRSNADGEFKIEGLSNGKYQLMYWKFSGEREEYTAKGVKVEIADDDISGVEIMLEKGATLTASVMLEAGSAPEIQQKFSTLNFIAYLQSSDSESGGFTNAPPMSGIDAAGNLHFSGLGTGKAMVQLVGNPAQKGFSIARTEYHGTPVKDGIPIKAGEQINDVHVFVAYSTASVRGEIKVEGGSIPADVNLSMRLNSTTGGKNFYSSADARGQFLFEGVIPGSYDLVVRAIATREPYDKPSVTLQENNKTIQVAVGQEQSVNVVVRIGRKESQQ